MAAQTFEFKKGIKLFYRYDKYGEIEVLYNETWNSLEDFIGKYYKSLKTYQEVNQEKADNKNK